MGVDVDFGQLIKSYEQEYRKDEPCGGDTFRHGGKIAIERTCVLARLDSECNALRKGALEDAVFE